MLDLKTSLLLAAGLSGGLSSAPQETATGEAEEASPAEAVTHHYVELARARYLEAALGAERLLAAVKAFLAEPGAETHARAKAAWLEAHEIYSHCEVFRFGNPNVDAWEGHVNAWPMDEGLIDYVNASYVFHEGNLHARRNLIEAGRLPINDEVIAELQSGADPKAAPITKIDDIESNVTRGFHAIEFLLWGQDPSARERRSGERPFTDYVVGPRGTGKRPDRRRDYLSAATRLLIQDLRFMVRDWDPENRLYAKRFLELPVERRLGRMLMGMGTLGFGELAGERMQVALLSGDQEEEQNCFSDTTHRAIYHNAHSIQTLYLGTQRRHDGTTLEGPSLSDLVRRVDPELDATLRQQLENTMGAADDLRRRGDLQENFDQMIQPDNAEGRVVVEWLMDRLEQQTASLELVQARLAELAKQ